MRLEPQHQKTHTHNIKTGTLAAKRALTLLSYVENKGPFRTITAAKVGALRKRSIHRTTEIPT